MASSNKSFRPSRGLREQARSHIGMHFPVGASLLANGRHTIFTPGVKAAGNTRLGVSSEATGYAQ
jgi:hypothetical protein